jgi:hypothetical protein
MYEVEPRRCSKWFVVEPTWISAIDIIRSVLKEPKDSSISSQMYDREIRRLKTMEHKLTRVNFASSAGSTQPSEDAPVECRSETSPSSVLDKTFIISAGNTLQVLVCLSSLMRACADDSDKVRAYAKLAEEKLQVLGELMRPMLWNPA